MLYLDEILSLAEVPRSLRDHRLRWRQGNIQINSSGKELPLSSKLNLGPKRCHLNLLVSLFKPLLRLVVQRIPRPAWSWASP
ncbi:hypothetical protein [Cyanobium sp. Morenito 9A2]|uniref:hypothetical protein n=1 Tax=Cyanobium sp. Morenito 9A2 TaxID=2823718 RepID=UPI0020CDEF2E|nr:hypothetical protein [Cyanobium sp. Morenito 9A2]MCP9848600.1 hypothetical protein [Cyanobium sp. Morenito 9A2]